MDKLWYIKQWNISVMMEYHAAIKKNEIMTFTATWMDLEAVILSEVGQRQILYDTAYEQNLEKSIQMNLSVKQT